MTFIDNLSQSFQFILRMLGPIGVIGIGFSCCGLFGLVLYLSTLR